MKQIKVGGHRSYAKVRLYALVDDADFRRLSKHNWSPTWNQYTKTYFALTRVNGKTVYMHREIIKPAAGLQVDHINHDTLDNRRKNLRAATPSQNMQNGRLRSTNKYSAKGIYYDKNRRKYRVRIMINGKTKHIGDFTDLPEASKAYNNAAKHYFGEFAYGNN